jgi:hypothetical protein
MPKNTSNPSKSYYWDLFKMPDLFGRRVNLLYEQKNYFKTTCGAFATMILVIGLVIVAVMELLKLYNQEIQTLKYYETHRSENELWDTQHFFSPKVTKLAVFFENQKVDQSILKINFPQLGKSAVRINC